MGEKHKKLNVDFYLKNNDTLDDLKTFAHGPTNGKVNIIDSNHINFNVSDIKKAILLRQEQYLI